MSLTPAFLWQVEGIGTSVAFSPGVLAGLREALLRAPAGMESGGILVGSVSSDGEGFRTQVDAFETFPIEHRHGVSYALSPHDRSLLERRLRRLRRKGQAPVGIWRSHQRRGLYLDQRDFDLFRTDFRHPSSLFLLVGRGTADGCTGAVFVWEEDDLRRHASYREFSLIERLAEPAPVMTAAVSGPIAAPFRPRAAPFRPRENRHTTAGFLGGLGTLPPVSLATAGKVLLMVALPLVSFYAARGIALHRAVRPAFDGAHPAREPSPTPVRADRDRAPGVGEKPHPFAVASSPVVAAGPVVSAAPEPSPSLAPDSRDRYQSNADSTASSERDTLRPAGAVVRGVPVLPEPPPIQPVRMAASIPRIVASPLVIAGRAPEQVTAYFKSLPPSSIRSAIQKAFTGHGSGDEFVAANPIEHPLPSPPPDAVAWGEGNNVEMLAKVDREGRVVYVKVVDGNRQLADRSADTLLRWRFDPARRKGIPVESALRIRFEFHGPSQ